MPAATPDPRGARISRIPESALIPCAGSPPPLPGSSLLRWTIAVGVGLAVFLTLLLLRRLIVGRLGRRAELTPGGFDDIAVDLARRTRALLILMPALWLGSQELQVNAMVGRVLKGAAEVAVFLQIALWVSLAIDLWVARTQRRQLEKDATSVALAGVLRFVGKLVLWAIIVLAALDNLGINVTALVAGLGIGGVAVALALQNVLSDLFASLSIVFDKPFVLGDAISVGEISGSVESIGLKTTRLRGAGGEQIIVANGELLKSRIHNWKRMSERRVVLAFACRARPRRTSWRPSPAASAPSSRPWTRCASSAPTSRASASPRSTSRRSTGSPAPTTSCSWTASSGRPGAADDPAGGRDRPRGPDPVPPPLAQPPQPSPGTTVRRPREIFISERSFCA